MARKNFTLLCGKRTIATTSPIPRIDTMVGDAHQKRNGDIHRGVLGGYAVVADRPGA